MLEDTISQSIPIQKHVQNMEYNKTLSLKY